MADYYTNVCFKLEWPEEAIHMLRTVQGVWDELVEVQDELVVDEITEDMIFDVAASYGQEIVDAFKQYADTDEIMSHGCDFHYGREGTPVIIVHDESANIDPLIGILAMVIQDLLPGMGLSASFEWAGTASRPLVDAYCGGAVVIDINGIDYTSTGQFYREREMKHMMLQVTELIDIAERRIEEITAKIGDDEPTLDLCIDIANLRNSIYAEGTRLKRFVRRNFNKPEEGSIYGK